MGLKEYFEKNFHLVSRWWKYSLFFILVCHIVFCGIVCGLYDGKGDLGELYFKVNNGMFCVWYME